MVQYTVYDGLGREIEEILNDEKPAVLELNFNTANLPSGVDSYKMTAGKTIVYNYKAPVNEIIGVFYCTDTEFENVVPFSSFRLIDYQSLGNAYYKSDFLNITLKVI